MERCTVLFCKHRHSCTDPSTQKAIGSHHVFQRLTLEFRFSADWNWLLHAVVLSYRDFSNIVELLLLLILREAWVLETLSFLPCFLFQLLSLMRCHPIFHQVADPDELFLAFGLRDFAGTSHHSHLTLFLRYDQQSDRNLFVVSTIWFQSRSVTSLFKLEQPCPTSFNKKTTPSPDIK